MEKVKKVKKKKTGKSALIKILIVIGIIVALLITAAVGLVAGALYGYVEDADLIDVENMRMNLTSFVYVEDAESGEMIEYEQLYDDENRVWVSGSQMPEHLKNAFVAIEDERFYKHSGIDYKRFIGAALQYLSSDGSTSYGGSTITQQLIKNITRDDDYSIKRKIQEAYRAYNLEKDLSKDEILEYYLNTIYLSQKCNGVASASMTYFKKDVSELSLAESACLAGITQFPTKYDPFVNREANAKRQGIILKKMLDLGFITQGEYESAKNEDLKFAKKPGEDEEIFQTYYVDAAIEQVINDLVKQYNYTQEYASKILYNGGLKIYLAMDPKVQKAVDDIYNNPAEFTTVSGDVQPQSSMVIMDPYTGEIKALTGGRGEKTGNRTLNRATQTLRQPGSTIKPLAVYSPAVEYGLVTAGSTVKDAPISFGGWTPRNDDHAHRGSITVAAALRGSRNIPAVKICNYLTTEAAFNFVKNNYHISTLVDLRKGSDHSFTDKGLAAIALGGLTDGATVLEMCAAYCAFPNGGKYIAPSTYTKVLDSEGHVLLEHETREYPALSETTAESMVSMLTGVVTGGTGTSAYLPNMRAAGKTGTTSSNKDRWFVGFTPYYVGAVWFGYDMPKSLNGFGGNPAAVTWRKVMSKVHEGLPNKEFFADDKDGKYDIMVCAESHKRATPACKKLEYISVDTGKVPTERCKDHPYDYNRNELNSGKDVDGNKGEVEEIPNPPSSGGNSGEIIIQDDSSGSAQTPSTGGSSVAPIIPPAPSAPAPSAPVPSTPAPSTQSGNSGFVEGI